MFNDKSYSIYKDCELLLVEKDAENLVKNDNYLNSYEFLLNFKEFISNLIDNDYLSPLMKNNVLNYLNVVRFSDNVECDSNWNKIIWLINDIIKLVNSNNCNKYVTFYRKEMYKRTNNDDYMNLPSVFIIQSEDKLCSSIIFDHLVLLSHSDKVDDLTFDREYIPKLIGNWKYFESINCILEEYPNKFLDKLFMERYQMVMNEFYSRDYGEPYNYGIVMFGDRVENKTKSLKKVEIV